MGLIIGGLLCGFLCGLIPYFVGIKKGQVMLAKQALWISTISGLGLGIILALPIALIYTRIIIKKPMVSGHISQLRAPDMATRADDFRTCPKCSATIRLGAVVCQYCGNQFSENEVAKVSPLFLGVGANRPSKRCPACSEYIWLDAIVCRFCGHNFSSEEVAQALQDHAAQMQAAAAAAQQAELARQQQRHLKRHQTQNAIMLGIGIILTGFGGLVVLLCILMFFSSPSPGNTIESQRDGAMAFGLIFGFFPLVIGIILLYAAWLAKRSPSSISHPVLRQKSK